MLMYRYLCTILAWIAQDVLGEPALLLVDTSYTDNQDGNRDQDLSIFYRSFSWCESSVFASKAAPRTSDFRGLTLATSKARFSTLVFTLRNGETCVGSLRPDNFDSRFTYARKS
jgi:hypothetical protein